MAALVLSSPSVPPLPSLALAFVLRDCGLQSAALACHLAAILPVLYVAAAVLAVGLVLCVVVAIELYRRRKLDRSTTS